jgi:hypothetical protein
MTQRLGVPPPVEPNPVTVPNPWLYIPGLVMVPQVATSYTMAEARTVHQPATYGIDPVSTNAGPYPTDTIQEAETEPTTWPHRPHPPLCNRAGSRWGKPPLQCHCWAWGPWLRSAPQGSYEVLTSARCSDGTLLTTTEGQPTLCAYWKPGITNAHENGFFKGVIHNIFGIKEEGAGKLKVFMVNCLPYIDTEAVHFVGSLDILGPIHNDQDHLRLLTILHQEHKSHRHRAAKTANLSAKQAFSQATGLSQNLPNDLSLREALQSAAQTATDADSAELWAPLEKEGAALLLLQTLTNSDRPGPDGR